MAYVKNPVLIESKISSKEFRHLKNPAAGALMNYTQIGLNFQFIGKIIIDYKSRIGYQDGYGGRLIGVSIC